MHSEKRDQLIQIVGWIASIAAVIMFVAYIDQIKLNLTGHKGSVIQPAATVVNCTLWVIYAAAKERKDWPIIFANAPGIVLGILTVLTAL